MEHDPKSEKRLVGFAEDVPSLTVEHLSKGYRRRRGQGIVHAVDDVSFVIPAGTAVGLVGASGSGKSTIARLVTGIEKPDTGDIRFGRLSIAHAPHRSLRELHRKVQMVFQDPYGALNPVHTVGYMVSRPSINYLNMSSAQAAKHTEELLERVGLSPPKQFVDKLPHQLSGGQRQRVVIARALACEPQLLIADEPVSMLDVSLRAGILRLLADLQRDSGLSLLYITHDLLSARVLTDHILVLNRGQIVEQGVTKEVLQHPTDPYTKQLLDALSTPEVVLNPRTP
ncbi:ATP-binding cassette domain-containing protein [Ferrimicrobium sp.]|uniref:ABC transporter ATP-binding protein n=1 Tax=Ferrimicrobium sp. TaxID=2926050 RepID=UPI002625C6FF|nr:ATP-binding cassette domain-containing protein [Ferrimicrobium sp.]